MDCFAYRITVSLGALAIGLCTSPALAQQQSTSPTADTTPVETTAQASTAQSNAASASAAAAANGDQSEIIVTGLKRNDKFLNTPVSVQVFSELAITRSGITRPQDFLSLTPNVTFITANHAGEFFVNIRGQASVRQSESAVAVVIDGVQLSTQNEFNGELVDIKQIEVLKGPQSAYYGRNATAGAIIITTKPPTDTFEGQVFASYGNEDSAKINASVGGPIVPGKLRFRAAISETTTDGSYTNIITGEKPQRFRQTTGRLRFDWEVSDRLTADFRLGASKGTGGGIGYNAQIAGTVVGGVPVAGVNTNAVGIPYVADVPGLNNQLKENVALKLDYDVGFATLTSVSSYNVITDDYQAKNFPYADYEDSRNSFGAFAVAFGDRTQKFRIANRAFTQEFRITSVGDTRFKWQAGLYYLYQKRRFITVQGQNGRVQQNPDGTIVPPLSLDANGNLVRTLQGGGVILPNFSINGLDTVNPTDSFDDNKYTYRNIAPFANASFDITDRLTFAAALRYDNERRTIQNVTPNVPNPIAGAATFNLCVLTTGRSPADCHDATTFQQVQPKATLTYKLPGIGSVFASYGKGFKSGGFNPIGTRATLLKAPGADPSRIFVQDTYNKEVSNAYEIGYKTSLFRGHLGFNGAVFQTDLSNAQQYEFYPTAGIQAVSSIDKARIKGFEFDINARPTDWLTLFGGYGYVDAKVLELKAAPEYVGNRTPYTANNNATVGAQVYTPLYEKLDFTARAEMVHTGSIWYDTSNLPGSRRAPVNLVNVRIGVANEKYSLTMWSRNLLDKQYNADAVPLLTIIQAVFPAPRRTFGLEGRVNF